MRGPRLLLLVSLATSTVGCGPTVLVDGHKLDQKLYEEERARVVARAKFDFSCPPEKIATSVVEVFPGSVEVSQFGVSGCDQRGTYVSTRTGWVLNAVADKSGGAQR
jgi:hypothetical protein